MNYIGILAGGIGTRMGNTRQPKQFLNIGGIPIIIHTIKSVVASYYFDYIYVAIHRDWQKYFMELLDDWDLANLEIRVVCGGDSRLSSIENIIFDMEKANLHDNDIVVIHDAVRPFVSNDLLKNSIILAKDKGAAVAALPVKDTMLYVEGDYVLSIPERSKIYCGQSPDAFQFSILRDAIVALTPEERAVVTGTAQICHLKGIDIYTFPGDERNIKITTMMDIFIAEAMMAGKKYDNESMCVGKY